jgi:hypothetical protein
MAIRSPNGKNADTKAAGRVSPGQTDLPDANQSIAKILSSCSP